MLSNLIIFAFLENILIKYMTTLGVTSLMLLHTSGIGAQIASLFGLHSSLDRCQESHQKLNSKSYIKVTIC